MASKQKLSTMNQVSDLVNKLTLELQDATEKCAESQVRAEALLVALQEAQLERRKMVYLVQEIVEAHPELAEEIETRRFEMEAMGEADFVPLEDYEQLRNENQMLRAQLASATTPLIGSDHIADKLQRENMQLMHEIIALRAGAETEQARQQGRVLAASMPRRNASRRGIRPLLMDSWRMEEERGEGGSDARGESLARALEDDSPEHGPVSGQISPPKAPSPQHGTAGQEGGNHHNIIQRSDSRQSVLSAKSWGEKRLQEHMGAFAYDEQDEDILVARLISCVDPVRLAGAMPGMAAHVIFMCVRYLDHENDAARLQSLLKKVISAIQETVKAHTPPAAEMADMHTVVFCLSTCCRLLSDMKQFSGDPKYASKVPTYGQVLMNFDLADYCSVLGDLSIMLLKLTLQLLQDELDLLAPSALLYHEGLRLSLAGHRTASISSTNEPVDAEQYSVSTLCRFFGWLNELMSLHCIDPEIIDLTMCHLVTYTAGVCLNELLVSRELCTDVKALQIAFNVQAFLGFLRDERLAAKARPEPLLAAINLLQMPKTSVESIELIGCECEELNVAQIQQLLSYYQGEGGATVPASWIQEGLQKRAEAEMRQPEGPQPLLVDLTRIPPIAIPYTPKDVLLSEVNPPDFLQLDMLRKI
eukprot:comp20215_c0_seq1/m.25144 comp20215_c0_seq1/g.25144  ORF comp20215_c0_seq1/g.25144 comp20215_c0_seq1/m.25144 type:complete len:646 (-) comp20215_c0_seq1:51-1988(-)